MKEKFFALVIFAFGIFNDTNVFSATKRKPKTNKTRSSSTVKNVSGKVRNNTFTGTINDAYTNTISDTLTCGISASPTNAQAKRLCAVAMAQALKTYCSEYPCTSKLKLELSFNFDLPTLSSVSTEINGSSCSGKDLNTFCISFQNELLDGLWDLYSEKNIRERKNCNMAKAKYLSAQDCFQYIISEKNSSIGNVFNASKITNLDEKIDEICGKSAIITKYKSIAIDDLTDNDIKTYLGGTKLNNDGTISTTDTGYQGKKKLSSTVASLFANVGDNTWNISGQIGKFADLTFNTKSNTYPRELTSIANTFISEGENACGNNFKSEMQDTSFELVDSRSALEKAIERKGLLKAVFDFTLDNTVAVVSDNLAEDIKNKGKNKQDKTDKNVYKEANEDSKNLEICDGFENITNRVKTILSHIQSAIKEIEEQKFEQEDSKEKLLQNNPKIIANLNKIIELDKNPETDISSLAKDSKLNDVKNTFEKLKEIENFNCKNKGFEKSGSVEFTFNYKENDIKAISDALLESANNFIGKIDNISTEDINNTEDIEAWKEIIKQMTSE